MKENPPWIVSAVAFGLGAVDLARGVVHTALMGTVAAEKSVLDFTAVGGPEQAVLMQAFGASNFVTGAALIACALMARPIALVLLTVIPFAYVAAGLGLEYWVGGLAATSGRWAGTGLMSVYLPLCILTAGFGWWSLRASRNQGRTWMQRAQFRSAR